MQIGCYIGKLDNLQLISYVKMEKKKISLKHLGMLQEILIQFLLWKHFQTTLLHYWQMVHCMLFSLHVGKDISQ